MVMRMDEQGPSDREQGPGAVVHSGVPPHPVPGGLPHHAHRVLWLRPQAGQLLREQPHPQAATDQGGRPAGLCRRHLCVSAVALS